MESLKPTARVPSREKLTKACLGVTLRSERRGSGRLVAIHCCRIVPGVFKPVLAKHSKSFWLIDCVSVGVERMQRNFEPMREQADAWQRSELMDVTAKVVIYEALVEGR